MYFTVSNNSVFPKTNILCDASTGRVFKTGKIIPDSESRLWKNRGHTLIGPFNTILMVYLVADDSPVGDERVNKSVQNLRIQKNRDRVLQAYKLWKKNPEQYLFLSSQGDIHGPIEIDTTTFMPSQVTPAFIPPTATNADNASASSTGAPATSAKSGSSSVAPGGAKAHGRAGGSLFIKAVVASITSSGPEEQSPQIGSEDRVDGQPPRSRIAKALVRAQVRRLIR
jgi:hypothetical protein